jgi:hypothetical protein
LKISKNSKQDLPRGRFFCLFSQYQKPAKGGESNKRGGRDFCVRQGSTEFFKIINEENKK